MARAPSAAAAAARSPREAEGAKPEAEAEEASLSACFNLDGDAFRELYPREYLARFLAEGVRPDGRAPGAARAVEVVRGASSSSDGSAMARIGSTTVIAAVRLQIRTLQWNEGEEEEGDLVVGVDVPTLATGKFGRANVDSSVISHRLAGVLNADVVDLRELCIQKGKFVWVAHLDVYCIDHSGSVFDAALLAAVAALRDLAIPAAAVSRDGRSCCRVAGTAGRIDGAMDSDTSRDVDMLRENINNDDDDSHVVHPHGALSLKRVPLSLTCGTFDGGFLADPTADEEAQLDACVTVAVDDQGNVLGFFKPGGEFALNSETMQMFVGAASMRHAEIRHHVGA